MHDFPRHWGPQGRYSHTVKGTEYGPSAVGEKLSEYKARVRGAYGSLRGVKFNDNGKPID